MQESKRLHICITSVLFDEKPEGICTGRLIRALLDAGHRVTVLTSSKESSTLSHPNLNKVVYPFRPRKPKILFRWLAALQGGLSNDFYIWSRKLANHDFKGDEPDMFYGRAWPHGSLVPAYLLAQRTDRPLWLHFSDPFPSPSYGDQLSERFKGDLQSMIDAATVLTFTNQETIHYQCEITPFDKDKAIVLNHVAPEPMAFGRPENRQHFYHVGTVGPLRPAEPLLEGFSLHLEKHPESRLFFVGAHEKYLRQPIEQLGLAKQVKVLPFTRDVAGLFSKAGVLISIDANIPRPVFTPTKIVDYLMTDRPILSITPKNSPVEKLLLRVPETAIAVTSYQPEAISEGLSAILEMPWSASAYQHRLQEMDDFSGASIVETLERAVYQS